jgi:glycosyltransferase involved in cell wall biosynthesis
MADEYTRHAVASKVRVVGLPIEPRSPAPEPARTSGTCRLLYLGRFEPSKGADIALEAAALAAAMLDRPLRLQLSGAGSLEAGLRRRATQLMQFEPRLAVTFTEWLDETRATAALDASDLLLVPSRWPEPFGMVGVEAALRGVPSIAFRVGGIPEWLVDGVTGRLVPADPPRAARFAEVIAACLGDDRGLARMRAHCRGAADRFRLSTHLTRLEPVLAEAVAARLIGASA